MGKRVKRNSWNVETMQKYCDDNNIDYTILDTKKIEKSYQSQLWTYVKCGNIKHEPYWVWWNNFLHGYRCKQCDYENNNKIMWSTERVSELLYKYGYSLMEGHKFKDVDTPMPCLDKDGFIYMITITNLRNVKLGKQSSFSLFKGNPYALDNIRLYCKLYRKDYILLSEEYTLIKDTYTFRYIGDFDDKKEHNREFQCTLDCFYHGDAQHPLLTRSKGEKRSEIFFMKHNIQYIAEKTFENCKDKQVLPFDFYLPEYNLVLEIMGAQHEHPIEFWGGEDNFKYIKYHDKIKRDYLKINGIELLEIWYWDFDNIEDILRSRLLKQSA